MEPKLVGENIEFTLKVFFCANEDIKEGAINLMSSINNNIPSSKENFIIGYPGEYEKDSIYILAIEGNAQKLSYFVFDYTNETSFAFLQDGEILEKLDTVKSPNIRFFTDKQVEDNLDKLGFEGERRLIVPSIEETPTEETNEEADTKEETEE